MMQPSDEEGWLRAAAAELAKEQQQMDPRMERLASGSLDALAVESLKQEAAEDPELARDLELFAPLSPRVRRRLHRVAARGRRRQTRTRRVLTWGAGPTVLAAASLVFVLWPEPDPELLPRYRLSFRARESSVRGGSPSADPSAASVRGDTEVTIALVPERSLAGALEFGLHRASPGRRVRVDWPAEVAPEGAVRWRGPATGLTGGVVGQVDLVAVVHRPGVDPPLPAEEDGLGSGPGWQAVRVRLNVRPVAAR